MCCGQDPKAPQCPTSCQPVIMKCTGKCPASVVKSAEQALTTVYSKYGEISGKGFASATKESRDWQTAAELEVMMMDAKDFKVEAAPEPVESHSYDPRPSTYYGYKGDERADWKTSNDLASAMWG